MTKATCIMNNCRKSTPADEPFCAEHRADIAGRDVAVVAQIVAWLLSLQTHALVAYSPGLLARRLKAGDYLTTPVEPGERP